MAKYINYILIPLLIASLLAVGAIEDEAKGASGNSIDKEIIVSKAYLPLAYESVRDTLYVLGNEYVEVNLDSQMASLNLRDGSRYDYKISSGTTRISRGIETPAGIFTVQSKSPMAVSRLFNNALLYSWIGVRGNVGFHGLAGNGYYGHLGVRSSSHGCIRIGREDGKELYSKVKLGTPVIVYKGGPARVLAFADWQLYSNSNSILLSDDAPLTNYIMRERLKNLYQGKAYTHNNSSRVFIDGSTVIRKSTIDVGSSSKIAIKQDLPLDPIQFEVAASDRISYKIPIRDTLELKDSAQK